MASEFIEEMKSTQQVAKSTLKMAAYDMKHFHDRKVHPPVKYQSGDLILLEATNMYLYQATLKKAQRQTIRTLPDH